MFSLKADDLYRKREKRSRLYLGKLRSIDGGAYVLYDDGIANPTDDAKVGGEEGVDEEEREAMRYIREERQTRDNNNSNNNKGTESKVYIYT